MGKELTASIMIFVGCALWFMCGIMLGNNVRKDYLHDQAQDTLAYCEDDDEVANCRIEWQYDGMILTGFEVVGQGV